MHTLCSGRGANVHGQWPFDELSCDLELGTLQRPAQLRSANASDDAGEASVRLNSTAMLEDTSGWQLLQARLAYQSQEIRTSAASSRHGDVAYRLRLRRNSTFYVRVFVGPLLTVHAMLLASFCCCGRLRSALCALSIVVTVAVLLAAGEYAPNSYVPRLVRWYEASMWLAWVACVLLVVDRRLAVCGAMWRRWRAADGDGDADEDDVEKDELDAFGAKLRRHVERALQLTVVRTVFGLEAKSVSRDS